MLKDLIQVFSRGSFNNRKTYDEFDLKTEKAFSFINISVKKICCSMQENPIIIMFSFVYLLLISIDRYVPLKSIRILRKHAYNLTKSSSKVFK